MHNRRARATIRVITDDLGSGWEGPAVLRAVAAQQWETLHPLSDLPHPLLRKARDWFGTEPGGEQLAGRVTSGNADMLLPTRLDHALLKRETAAARLTNWELKVQATAAQALSTVAGGGVCRIDIKHPAQPAIMAQVDLEVGTEKADGFEIETCVLTVDLAPANRGSALGWQLTLRLLATIWPPEQGWDRFADTYSTMVEPGQLRSRAEALQAVVERGELASLEPGRMSHYTHSAHISGSVVEGSALRALCGVFFVPYQTPDGKERCPECARVWAALPN